MDPLITNRIDPGLLSVLEKRGQERDATPPRKRAAVPEKVVEEGEEEDNQEPGPDTPKHTLDDLA